MTPETEKLIAQFPELSEDQAKLIFVRQSAQEAYEKGEIKEALIGHLKEVVEVATCSNMNIEEIGKLIGDLELARNYLAAFTQGLMKAHASKVEPEIKAKRARERKEKLAKKLEGASSKGPKANDLMALALAAVEKGAVVGKAEEEEKKVVSKVKCEKCGKEVYTLKFHKC